MGLMHWVIGPQLIGLIMLFAGYIQQAFPPTDIDGPYGYRTTTSRQSQQTFDEGNKYSSKLLMKLGTIAIIIGLVVTPFVDEKHEFIQPILVLVVLVAISVFVISRTDKHLKQMFDNQDNEIL